MKNEGIIMLEGENMDNITEKTEKVEKRTQGKENSAESFSRGGTPTSKTQPPETEEDDKERSGGKGSESQERNFIKNLTSVGKIIEKFNSSDEEGKKLFTEVEIEKTDGEREKKFFPEFLKEFLKSYTKGNPEEIMGALSKNILVMDVLLKEGGKLENMPGLSEEAGGDVRKKIYKTLGFGNAEVGKKLHESLVEAIKAGGEQGKQEGVDFESIIKGVMEDSGIDNFIDLVGEFTPVPIDAGGEGGITPAPGVKAGGEGGITPAPGVKAGGEEKDKEGKDIFSKLKLNIDKYKLGILILFLILLYLSAMGKWAELIEQTGERTAQKRGI